jgi:flavin reductase (DIM6/NTAB) family NADH-FMN oxidoreductase RutF
MVSIDHSRYSHAGIRKNREFVVNYPSAGQEHGAWACGTVSGRDIDKIKTSGLEFVDSKVVKAPTVDGAAVAFECQVVGEFETGDHTVFVGQVVATRGNPDEKRHLFVTADFRIFALDNDLNS